MKALTRLVIIISLLTVFVPVTSAQDNPHDRLCDVGSITGAEVLIAGNWVFHPDSREGWPRTLSTGPFPVRANMGGSIVRMELFYWGGTGFVAVPMTGEVGTIPALTSLPADQPYVLMHFYLIGYDGEGNAIEIDEIAYTCNPYTGGDPYSFIITNPVGGINQVIWLFDGLVTEGALEGRGPGFSGERRLNLLRRALIWARDLAYEGQIDYACSVLSAVGRRVDGDPRPPDFVTGSGVGEFHSSLVYLQNFIGCSW